MTLETTAWTAGRVRLSELVQLPRNPKEHDVPSIRGSICRFGFTEIVVINTRTGRLVAGHGRDKALTDLQNDPPINDSGHYPQGYYQTDTGDWLPKGITLADDGEWLIPNWFVDVLEAEEEPLALALNQLTIKGGWNIEQLGDVLREISAHSADAVHGLGFSPDEINLMTKGLDFPPLPEVPDDENVSLGRTDIVRIRIRNPEALRDVLINLQALFDDNTWWEAEIVE